MQRTGPGKAVRPERGKVGSNRSVPPRLLLAPLAMWTTNQAADLAATQPTTSSSHAVIRWRSYRKRRYAHSNFDVLPDAHADPLWYLFGVWVFPISSREVKQ